MNLIIKNAKDNEILEDEIAYIKAILIKKCIDDLKIKKEYKNIIEMKIINILNKK